VAGSAGAVARRTPFHKRGTSVCSNGLRVPVERVDRTVLSTLTGDVLRPAVVMAILDGVLEAQRPRQGQNPLEEARRALHRLEREIARLTEAIAAGGTLASLLKALRDREVNRWHDPHDRSSRGRTSALAGSARLAAQICARGPNVPLRGAGVVQKSARRNSRVSN